MPTRAADDARPAARLRARIDEIPRLRRRALLIGILEDVETGTCSVLEHRYLTDVERAHGLPLGIRQDRVIRSGRPMMRDVVYRGPRRSWTQVVELDGRLDHDNAAARDRDLERDLDAAIEREHSVRIGYGQVFDRAVQHRGQARAPAAQARLGWTHHSLSELPALMREGRIRRSMRIRSSPQGPHELTASR